MWTSQLTTEACVYKSKVAMLARAKLPYPDAVPSLPSSSSETQTRPKFPQKLTTHPSLVSIVPARFVYRQQDLQSQSSHYGSNEL